MSLRKKQTMTPRKASANQANGKRSRGPTTREGRERSRDANLRHGFYSQDRDRALRALGENPEDFAAVVESVMEKWPPADTFEERLGMRLARAMWRMERGDRMQEGYALRQAKEVDNSRESRLHARLMRLKMTAASFESLAHAVAREHYVTTPTDLELMKSLQQEGEVKEMGEIALALFFQLQEPGQRDEEGRRVDPDEMSRRALVRIKEIFGLTAEDNPDVSVAPGFRPPQESQQDAGATPESSQGRSQDSGGLQPNPERVEVGAAGGVAAHVFTRQGAEAANADVEKDNRYPRITAAQWEAREPVRQLLENILTRQAEVCEEQRKATLRECLAGPSPFERAAEIAPSHRNALLMRRMEDSSFRQVSRITSLLLKLKRRARENESAEGPSRCQKLHENKNG